MIKFKVILFSLVMVCLSSVSFASEPSEPNFKCEIFAGVEGNIVRGSLKLYGDNVDVQTYELEVAEGADVLKKFTGNAYLVGLISFTNLPSYVQKALMNAMDRSKRPGLTSGDLVSFTNTEKSEDSTLNIFLMPTGEIGYLQIGLLEALCM